MRIPNTSWRHMHKDRKSSKVPSKIRLIKLTFLIIVLWSAPITLETNPWWISQLVFQSNHHPPTQFLRSLKKWACPKSRPPWKDWWTAPMIWLMFPPAWVNQWSLLVANTGWRTLLCTKSLSVSAMHNQVAEHIKSAKISTVSFDYNLGLPRLKWWPTMTVVVSKETAKRERTTCTIPPNLS